MQALALPRPTISHWAMSGVPLWQRVADDTVHGTGECISPIWFGRSALSPNTVVEYRYATSEPDTRMDKGFDSAPADLSESGPHVSLAGFTPAVERAHHHELSVSQRVGKNKFQVAVYSDRVTIQPLRGSGMFRLRGNVLPDLYSGTFTYQGTDLRPAACGL